jgi:transposase
VRSSRKLERECHRNLELIWLMKKLSPDFWTISEFRKQNVVRIKGVFREFVAFLQDIDLVEGKLATIDGSKMKAWNATKRNFNRKNLAIRLKHIEERVNRYLKELEQNDTHDDTDDDEDRELMKKRNAYLRAKLESLAKRKKELEAVGKKLDESGQNEISLTDPDSRLMKNNRRLEVCYNAEMAVDAKEKMIVNYDVTNKANDEEQLAPMAISTKEALGVDKLDVTTDGGFTNTVQIKECVDNGITPYLPSTRLDGGGGGTRVPDPASFGKDRFLFDTEKDAYICPAGKELRFTNTYEMGGRMMRAYRTPACSSCPFRARCTTNKMGRMMFRWEHQEIIDDMTRRMRSHPEMMQVRAELAEHPFGTIKRAFNQGYFLLKGLRKVNAEMGFTVIAYDMRRALSILGTRRLLQALKGLSGGGTIIGAR